MLPNMYECERMHLNPDMYHKVSGCQGINWTSSLGETSPGPTAWTRWPGAACSQVSGRCYPSCRPRESGRLARTTPSTRGRPPRQSERPDPINPANKIAICTCTYTPCQCTDNTYCRFTESETNKYS